MDDEAVNEPAQEREHLPDAASVEAVAEVKALELAFQAAANAGSVEGMFKYLLPGRTVFGPAGGLLVTGWTEEGKRRRQDQFDVGRRTDLSIRELDVCVFGDSAVSTFYRIGTAKDVLGISRGAHLRISGVWVRSEGKWKLAHRHESLF